MAGRTADISTSSFKPLNLQEIMMVPLAKQQQEDNISLGLEELSTLESNSMDVDKEYVSGQIASLQKEADLMSEDLINKGVSSNLSNRLKSLRKRKNKEFSLEGKTGRAAEAYKRYKTNELNIMNRKDLSSLQKQLGLEEAKRNYTQQGGASSGAEYQNYIGASEVDLEQKGREIASLMKPQELAGMLGMDYDERTGMYTDGTYSSKTLPADQIQKVIYQALKSDQGVKDYLDEVGRLGIGDPESMLSNSARNAGNIFQRNDYSENIKPVNPAWSNRTVDGNKMIDPNNNSWDSQLVRSNESPFYDQIGVDENYLEKIKFNGESLNVDFTEEELKESLKLEEEIEDYKSAAKEMSPLLRPSNKDQSMHIRGIENKYSERVRSKYGNSKVYSDVIKGLELFKENHPDAVVDENGKPFTDKKIIEKFMAAKKEASQSFTQVIQPRGEKKEWNTWTERQKGKAAFGGMKFLGGKGNTGDGGDNIDVVAKKLDMSPAELQELIENSNNMGLASSDPDFPMGLVVQITVPDDSSSDAAGQVFPLVLESGPGISGSNNSSGISDTARMSRNLMSGKSYEVSEVSSNGGTDKFYKHFVTKYNPYTQKIEPFIINSKEKFDEEKMKSMTIKPGSGGAVIKFGENEYEGKYKIENYESASQRNIDNVTTLFGEDKK